MSAAQPPKSPDNNSPDHDHAGVDMVDKDQYAWFFPKHKCALSKAGLTQINTPSREQI
jgi:hypothetical protein